MMNRTSKRVLPSFMENSRHGSWDNDCIPCPICGIKMISATFYENRSFLYGYYRCWRGHYIYHYDLDGNRSAFIMRRELVYYAGMPAPVALRHNLLMEYLLERAKVRRNIKTSRTAWRSRLGSYKDCYRPSIAKPIVGKLRSGKARINPVKYRHVLIKQSRDHDRI